MLNGIGELFCFTYSKKVPQNASKDLFPFAVVLKLDLRLATMFSPENLKLDADVLNIHLFMSDHADRLIGLALTASATS